MSGYEILCWGDPLYLRRVLDALALLAGHGDLKSLALLGCLIGLVFACVQAVISGGREFPLVHVVFGAVLYVGLFAHTVPVIITPLNTTLDSGSGESGGGGSTVVDGVPWGAAMIGTVISGAGVKLTQLFEQAFSTPTSVGVTNGGLGKTLSYVTAVRLMTTPYLSTNNEVNATHFYDWRNSLSAYIHDCTIAGLNSPSSTGAPQRIFTANHPLDGIHYASPIWYTLSYVGGPEGTKSSVSCDDAYTRLNETSADGRLSKALDDLMTARYRLEPGTGTEAVSNALAQVGSSAAADMQDYMMATLVNAIWLDALSDGPRLDGNVTQLIALHQADEQRTSDWIGGANLFLSSLRPVLSFFEALTYAVAPFLVFMIGLGARGWKILGSYFMLALWVQLWLPILAVCNLFLITGMEHVVAGLGGEGASTTVANVILLQQQALHWLALGALFVQITPFLALALIYGGAVTATTLAGRMAGQDYYNEKIVSPDAVSPAPALQMGPQFQQTAAGGVVHADAKLLTISPQTASEERVSSADAFRNSTAESAVQRASVIAGHNANLATTFGNSIDGSDQTSATSGEGAKADTSTRHDASAARESHDKDSTTITNFDHNTSSKYNIGIPGAGIFGMSGGSNDSSGEKGTEEAGGSRNQQHGRSDSASESKESTLKKAHQIAATIASMESTGGMKGVSASDAQELDKIRQDVQNADKSYEEAVSASKGMSTSQSMPVSVAANNFLKSDAEAQAVAYDLMKDPHVRPTFEAAKQALGADLVDPQQIRAGATLMTLGRLGTGASLPDLPPNIEAVRLASIDRTFPHVFPGSAPDTYAERDAGKNSGLAEHAPTPGVATEETRTVNIAPAGAVVTEHANINGAVEHGAATTAGNIAANPSEQEQVWNDGTTRLVERHKDDVDRVEKVGRKNQGAEAQPVADVANRAVGEMAADGQLSYDTGRFFGSVYDSVTKPFTSTPPVQSPVSPPEKKGP